MKNVIDRGFIAVTIMSILTGLSCYIWFKKPHVEPPMLNMIEHTYSGMTYIVFYTRTGDLKVINKTKDSLEVEIDKKALWEK